MLGAPGPALSMEQACKDVAFQAAAHDWTRVHPQFAATLSISIADDAHLDTHEQRLAAAERHLYLYLYLYRAKHEGKNRVCWRGIAPPANHPCATAA